jgi:3-methyladenine DNA glycosylase Tag
MPTAQPAAPVEKSKAALMQESFLEKSPENERIAAMERMKAMIKEPDNSQRDAMIKQLQAERDRQVGPQDSYGQLMEYLGQIAATPRGLSSFGAGAAGVRGINAL